MAGSRYNRLRPFSTLGFSTPSWWPNWQSCPLWDSLLARCVMPKKRKAARKVPKKPKQKEVSPLDRLAWHYRQMISQQWSGFLGALKYDRKRKPEDAIVRILVACLSKRLGRLATSEDVDWFFAEADIGRDAFSGACLADWRFESGLGDLVFELLKQAGYAGNIDQLWLSVYGRWKPSCGRRKPSVVGAGKTTGRKARRRRAKHCSDGQSVFVVNTGQTRKPGSHRSS
jgi:hypothetical protein